MNIQSRLQYKTARLKRKLYDNGIRKKGLDIRVLRLEVEEDKFGNKDFSVIDHGMIDLVIDVPGQSLQYFQGQRDSNNSSYNTNLSIYSYLPITAWPTNDSELNNGDLILFKYLKGPYDEVDQEVQLQVFQVANAVAKGVTTILYSEFTLSPYNFNVDEYPEVKQIIEEYKLEPIGDI